MIRKFKYILFLLPLLFVTACSDNDSITDVEKGVIFPGDLIQIFTEYPDAFSTRGVEDAKKSFVEGDLIHLEATFYEDKGKTTFLRRDYQIFQKDASGEWKQMGNSELFWPNKAALGTFRAYYVKKFIYKFVKGDIPQELRLSDVEDQTDPLYAETEIEWGHRINLRFSHLCTHLTFNNLDPDIADYFWLIKRNDEIKNVFTLELTDDNRIKESFITRGDANYDSLAYVQHRSENVYVDNIKTASKVGFYLAPGDYSNLELRTINNYSYLAFQSEKTSDLEANIPYEVDITHHKGVTFVEDEEPWDEEDEEVTILDPEDFLRSITEGTDYNVTDETGQKKRVLQSTADGILLCCNVSLGYNKEYNKFEIPTGLYFDGGNHYISEIATNLFSTNRGTIRHLGLKDIEAEVELWYHNQNNYYNRWGVLCELNEGVIRNVRIEDSSVTFSIGEGKDQPGVVYNIGSLIGSNNNILSEVDYGGKIQLNSQIQNDIDATVNIGGLIGQSNGLVSDISPMDENSEISVSHRFSGNLISLYIGGAVGQSSTDIRDVSLTHVNVDSSQGTGLIGNTGGLVGRLRSTSGSASLLSSCTVAGIVKGYPVTTTGNLKAYSYTGGLAGYSYNYDVTDCRTLCDVEVKEDVSLDGDVMYGVGGGFGRIISDNNIYNNYIWGNYLKGPSQYKGNFAGVVPASISWNDYESARNKANNIIPGQYIGDSIDDIAPVD